jgi:hypothetical protein
MEAEVGAVATEREPTGSVVAIVGGPDHVWMPATATKDRCRQRIGRWYVALDRVVA